MVRIAVISDIHFGKFSRTIEFAVPGEGIQDENRGAISLKKGFVNILKDMGVKYLFVCGDLTSIASPQEFYFCEEILISIADEVGIEHGNILCCLGNHDIDRNVTKLGDEIMAKDVPDEVKKIVKEKYNLIAANCATTNLVKLSAPAISGGPAPYSGICEEKDFIVFVLNSGWECTHDQDYSHGKLTNEQLSWFENVSSQYKDDHRTKFVLLHHHPFGYPYPIPVPDISQLEEGSEFLDIVVKNKIDIIIHGHRHHPIAKTIQLASGTNPVTLICAGSLSVNSAHRNYGEIPNTMHILELNEIDKTTILYNYKYSSSEGWKKMEYCNETPLDYEMKLGKLFGEDQIEKAIKNLSKSGNESYQWEDLEECLQYLTYADLNEKIKNILSEDYKIIGKFPDEVFFLKK